MYSSIGIDSFKTEVLNGESITKELAAKQIKEEKYFRFPYNDLGSGAGQQRQAAAFLRSRGYIITPFTVHSKDWLFTQLYDYYKSHNMPADAERIGKAFIEKTLVYFDYIESLTSKNRPVMQIYLMHDNSLNADYLDKLIEALKKKGYRFITLDEAMTDPVYAQKDYYPEKGGISWVYRWIKNEKQRGELIKQEPDTHEIEAELEKIKQMK
jgi:peptidoglycan/xylan/chitin deacetylase (PgdA/CDA1 family)